jgi:hypothetical protein
MIKLSSIAYSFAWMVTDPPANSRERILFSNEIVRFFKFFFIKKLNPGSNILPSWAGIVTGSFLLLKNGLQVSPRARLDRKAVQEGKGERWKAIHAL